MKDRNKGKQYIDTVSVNHSTIDVYSSNRPFWFDWLIARSKLFQIDSNALSNDSMQRVHRKDDDFYQHRIL